MKYKKLIELASVVDSLHQTPKYSDEGIPMVRVTDVKGGRLSLKDCLRVDEVVYKKFTANHEPTYGDIVISRVGTYGNFSFVSTNEQFCLGQNTAIITPHINPDFLYYCLTSKNVRNQIEQKVVGSTQKTLSLKNIKELEIPDVDEITQEKVAGILRNFDEKIELNSKINDNLLQQAQTIYREMFVIRQMISAKLVELKNTLTSPLAKLLLVRNISGSQRIHLMLHGYPFRIWAAVAHISVEALSNLHKKLLISSTSELSPVTQCS